MPTKPHSKDQTYWAFISYRHTDNKAQDREWANWLHQEIERYEIPAELVGTKNKRGDTIPERIYPVFRDEESLSANADLKSSIERALDNSLFLVALCSPRSVESTDVDQEIEHFKSIGKSDRIIAAIIAGEPGHPTEECFPAPLREIVSPNGNLRKPLAADFRLRDGSEGYTSAEAYKGELLKTLPKKEALKRAEKYAERLQLMKLKVIAGILGLPIETIRDRDKAYQLQKAKRRQKILTTVITTISLLTIAAIIGGVIAWKNQKIAEQKTSEAEKQTALTKAEQEKQKQLLWQASEADCEAGIAARNAGRDDEALAYFERGFRYAQDNPRNGWQALNVTFAPNSPYFHKSTYGLGNFYSTFAYSTDGKLIAAGSQDGSLCLFDQSGTKLWHIDLKDTVSALAFSPNEQSIVVACKNGTILLFAKDGTKRWQNSIGKVIDSVKFSPGSPYLAVVCRDSRKNFLHLLSIEGKEIWKRTFVRSIEEFTFSPNGTCIAVGCFEPSLHLLDLNGIELWKSVEFEDSPTSLIFFPDSTHLISGSIDAQLCLFDIKGNKLWGKDLESPVRSVAISPDSSRIATTLENQSLHLFDTRGAKSWRKSVGDITNHLVFSPDGSRLAVTTVNAIIRIFDLEGTKIWEKNINHAINTLIFSPDCSRIATYSLDGQIHLFETQGSARWKPTFGDRVTHLAYSPDGTRLAAGTKDGHCKLLSPLNKWPWFTRVGDPVSALAYSPKGTHFASGFEQGRFNEDYSLELFNLDNKSLWKNSLEDRIYSLAISKNGSSIAASLDNGTLYLFDLTGEIISRSSIGDRVNITFLSNGSLVAANIWKNTLQFLDSRGNPHGVFNFENKLQKLTFSSHSAHIAASSKDNSLQLFNSKGKSLWKNTFKRKITNLAISPNGTHVAAVFQGNLIRVFNEIGKEIWEIAFKIPIDSLALAPDSSQIAVSTEDGDLNIFSLDYFIEVSPLDYCLLTNWISTHSFYSFNRKGQLTDTCPISQTKAQIAIDHDLTSKRESPLLNLLRWRLSEPIDQSLSHTSNILLREYVSQSIREFTVTQLLFATLRDDNIRYSHTTAPWHPLVPLSLAKLERNKNNELRKKFLCQLTLKRLKAADPEVWGKDRLAEDAAFAAGVMGNLGYPDLAKEATEFKSSLQSPSEDE